ncbi:hypothetical protein DACRYDRAFT_108003 [Dacryopinax primogenitus]|uniref:DUF1308 domain-containing protein n=1 Tax=Dacryopinax primogenitus (strain DJM 731) TaxID=1858805 RepID=M5GBR2_DACPD|nr:uncharacterized protein DACRYDRAFT_108003 [Dacryopinax primogenitus]EJU01453.1 hypothetical protein DACRYDRAFT_108003 [Dacryopinax primogenitus]
MELDDLISLRAQLVQTLTSIQALSTTSQLWRGPIIQPESPGENGAEVPGLKFFEGSVRREIETFDKSLANEHRSLSTFSTNAQYFLAVWREVLRAPPSILSIGKNVNIPRSNGRDKPSVKVDIIADDGRQWIRVNTIKNSRLLAELREIDSYISEDESEEEQGDASTSRAFAATRPATEVDNSILRMARDLLTGAANNPLPGGKEIPRIQICLTRLEIGSGENDVLDSRVQQTVDKLRTMGVTVQLGEWPPAESEDALCLLPNELRPTRKINLDLSLLIALISDLTHAPLPQSAVEADSRFRSPVRPWKERNRPISSQLDEDDEDSDFGDHSRALSAQLEQEMKDGLLEDMRDILFPTCTPSSDAAVEFWTTKEAMQRCLSIVTKIGGPGERRRAAALFITDSTVNDPDKNAFWQGSRHPVGYLPGLPVRTSDVPYSTPILSEAFLARLAHTCQAVLASAPEQASVPRTNPAKPIVPHLTAHTIRSFLKGAVDGMTTLTANKMSIRAIMREMRSVHANNVSADPVTDLVPQQDKQDKGGSATAWLWVVEPRSLAESMRTDLGTPDNAPHSL